MRCGNLTYEELMARAAALTKEATPKLGRPITTGEGYCQRRSREIKVERRYCERCSKDLIDAKWGFWCTHHKDHDRTNSAEDNFELLCTRCHHMEHRQDSRKNGRFIKKGG